MKREYIPLIICLTFTAVRATAALQKPAPAAPSNPPASANDPSQQHDSKVPDDTPHSAMEDLEVANFYIHKGDPDAAIPRLEEAIRLQPKLAKPYLLLADLYEKRGDAPDAVKYYKEYLQVFPSAGDARKIQKKIERLTSR